MADDPRKVVAYVKADALVKAVFAAAKNWPTQEKGLFLFLRDKALRLPGMVMAGVLSEARSEESVRLLSEALVTACEAEYVSKAVVADASPKVHAAAVEAREAVQDHLDAMLL